MRKWTCIVIWAAVGVALVVPIAYAVDHYRKARQPSSIDPCIANLKMIAEATHTWAIEHHKTTNDIPTWPDLIPVYLGSLPTCHQGGIYTLVRVMRKPTCAVPGHSLQQ